MFVGGSSERNYPPKREVIFCVRGVVSPLLANLYLDRLDKEMEARGLAFVRYADDIAIYAHSQRAAERILEGVTDWLGRCLKVEVNREKSGAGLTEESS